MTDESKFWESPLGKIMSLPDDEARNSKVLALLKNMSIREMKEAVKEINEVFKVNDKISKRQQND